MRYLLDEEGIGRVGVSVIEGSARPAAVLGQERA